MPVDDGDQIIKAFLHRHIGNISSTNLIDLVYYLTFEQILVGEHDPACRGAQSSFCVPLCLMIELSV